MLTETIRTINNHSYPTQVGCFVFISSCFDVWGGSEELLAATAKYLKQQGHEVHVFKLQISDHPRILELQAAGVKVIALNSLRLMGIKHFVFKCIYHLVRLLKFLPLPASWYFIHTDPQRTFILQTLRRIKPSLVVISQGDNFDGLNYGDICLELKLPYVMLSHKASHHIWPVDALRPMMRKVFQQAKRCFFVSEHNLFLTQMQLGQGLSHAEVVRNPYLTSATESLPWPEIKDNCFKLACVGRLWLVDKGQDILLEVLAQEKWKYRNLQVSFFGEGANRDTLIDMANLLGLKNVNFPGFVENIESVWQDYHALILPSRAEGLPITLVEAMMCGRIAITTNVGGIPEVLEDNITGFIAKGTSFAAIDEALERAWQRSDEWENMGTQASISIRKQIPKDPERLFADKLLQLSTLEVNSAHKGART
ncbi:glycosyltransferase [Anabaena cylindrica FACHB-243]|uniref:Glycosyl transferase group 1 n=1 Tax=Anabaena cylindrica (strain ATCC 27899 / PCC 7122) TaxID=272123 RepID=K9ZIJ9_ANACC|nr:MULTISPECIES: glycosyltransferase [Anabaena]AFZ59058.1 glycosyl transferase group 1 [Anabaena cylindrica PCC 7122]MBD2420603.1 glycosyltransferase [Anabaena cylindrica FACHB-243]MBY5282354.1 glycosyltransferase family 4 protein [Anabaena sp. CCAP 1446/1C]MBY5309235.1 glycosyltransferase family 4 protein [Anabaena sp. CCAP 1446/1C]MCM2408561.1 glycosyltransferase [Anabaena sp. CCAP 1446/1C]